MMNARIISNILFAPTENEGGYKPQIRWIDCPDPEIIAQRRDLRVPDRFSKMALAAAEGALAAARLLSSSRVSCVFSTTFNTRAVVENWLSSLSQARDNPAMFPSSTSSVTVGHIAQALGIQRSVTVLNNCSPLQLALDWLASGREDVVLVVATEELRGAVAQSLAEACPDTMFSEASAAVVLARDRPEYSDSPRVLALESCTNFIDGDMSATASEPALRTVAGRMAHQLEKMKVGSWALCSVSISTDSHQFEPSGHHEAIFPRISIGDTLGASSLTALCSSLKHPGERRAGFWVIDDTDHAGGALSMLVEIP